MPKLSWAKWPNWEVPWPLRPVAAMMGAREAAGEEQEWGKVDTAWLPAARTAREAADCPSREPWVARF